MWLSIEIELLFVTILNLGLNDQTVVALEKATNAQALEMNFKGIFLSEGSRILN